MAKDKLFNIAYQYTTFSDAKVTAPSKKEAIRRLREILPEITVDGVWEAEVDKDGLTRRKR